MIASFLLWLMALISACTPAPDVAVPTPPVTQHEGRTIHEHRPAELGPVVTIPSPVCTEDMDCWDCHTMGNLICGPVTEPAPVCPEGHRMPEDMSGCLPGSYWDTHSE